VWNRKLNVVKELDLYSADERKILEDCTLCPRKCRVNRFQAARGYCRTGAGFSVASICIHKGEEPVISGKEGICNIFFTGCNLRCIYCQNHEISSCRETQEYLYRPGEILDQIENILSKGIPSVGFVSPSHVVPQVRTIINGLNERGLKPITVYNTNGYDKPEIIRSLSGLIDVYLPDFKYASAGISSEYSDASDYPDTAFKAIKEMYYQKGSTLSVDGSGRAENGLLVRHLVLPGHAEESKKVLRIIAEELSPGIHLSLMSQYHPIAAVRDHPVLNRSLYKDEYESVVREMESLGFRNGWIQDMESNVNYRPDFSKKNPFE
jgi:putative pyruvate formate lyase activating enzyme